MDWSNLHTLIGYKAGAISWWQMTIRGTLIFLFGLLLVRMAGRRMFGKFAALDIILAVLIGSNLSRALTGNAPFVPTLAATAGLVLFYWILAYAAFYIPAIGWLVKGRAQRLVHDGKLDRKTMKRHGLTDDDLREALRAKGVADPAQVSAAYIERDGTVSVVKRSQG